jgi:hypothetical protein
MDERYESKFDAKARVIRGHQFGTLGQAQPNLTARPKGNAAASRKQDRYRERQRLGCLARHPRSTFTD